MKKFHKTASSVAVAALFSLFSATSNATVISSASSNPLGFSWSYNAGGTVGLLTGTGSLTVSGFNSSELSVLVSLTNTADAASERLTAFGFGINPNANSVTFSDAADGGMVDAELSFIPSLATIEVCAYGGQNCQGGSNGGILGVGGSDSFTIKLGTSGGTWGSSVDIAPIGFKYQTDGGSFEFTGTPDDPDTPSNIPEPGVLLLLGAGLMGMGLARRRKPA